MFHAEGQTDMAKLIVFWGRGALRTRLKMTKLDTLGDLAGYDYYTVILLFQLVVYCGRINTTLAHIK
jgi:hypothetical protein